jgi:hypothetical protein
MAEYGADSVTVTYAATPTSSTTDLNRTLTQTHASPTKHMAERVTTATGGTTVATMANFTTIESLYVWNRDATNYVTFTYGTAAAASQTQKLLAGQWCKINSLTVATSLVFTANSSSVIVDILGIGT